jgi:uncharacterized protein (TIGR00369 family)
MDFDRTPVNRHLGFRLVARDAAGATVAMDAQPAHAQEEGVIHGGILTALADTAAVYALLPDLPPDRTTTSIEFKMNFLRPARPAAGELRAVSRLVRTGRTIAVCEVDVHQDAVQVATGTFTYLFLDRRS